MSGLEGAATVNAVWEAVAVGDNQDPIIRIDGLSYTFQGSRRMALRDITLSIEPGEFVLVNGPSGSGKSVLALAIGGYLFRQYDGRAEGSVTVAEMDVIQRPIYDVAEVVGLVQQNPEAQFCTLTVRDEVAFGLENRCLPREKIRERMGWALSIVGASHLGDRALVTLSGGEKQKVAIASVMAAKPQVLILDEPTSNLDPSATAEIFGVIEHIRDKAGLTVIVIEHKIRQLLRSVPVEQRPRLVSMADGAIVYDGPLPAAALQDPPPHRVDEAPGVAPGPQPRFRTSGEQAASESPLVAVTDLRAGYGKGDVLHGITVEVYPGEFVSVMGDNGSGKSTLLQCLLGLVQPSGGSVEVLGRDTQRVPVSQLARQVGYVFQNPEHQLFGESVWDEVMFAPRQLARGRRDVDAETEARAAELLDRCGLGDRRDDHPYRLSYGQKRRLNLVSVLSYDPRVLLLDELLIGQDPANARFLLDLLSERVAAGAAVLLVNHAPELARRYASRLLFLEKGRVLVDAPAEEGFARLSALGREAYVP